MRTYLIIIILFFSITNLLHAQDTLYKADGSRHIVKIIEINETQVKYKPEANNDLPTYVISKDDVKKIVYQNGEVVIFPRKTKNSPIPTYKPDPRSTDFGRNFISINAFDLFFRSLTFAYEYTFKRGNFSLKFPVSIGFNTLNFTESATEYYYGEYSDYYHKNKIFSTGLDFYFYPTGQGKAKFYSGPSAEYGQYNSRVNGYYYYPYNLENGKGNYYAFILQNGFLFQPAKHFNFSLNVGVGYTHSSINYKNNTGFIYHNEELAGIALRAGVNLGVKF